VSHSRPTAGRTHPDAVTTTFALADVARAHTELRDCHPVGTFVLLP
jgi:hypothetical protein